MAPQTSAQPAVATAPPAARAGLNGVNGIEERLWQNERTAADQAVALVEREQRISALGAERDWLASQLDEERRRREGLEPELDIARGEWAAAEKRAADYETSFQHASIRLQHAELAVAELTRQLETVKTERSEAVLSLAHHHETLAEMNLQLDKARAERAEMEQIAGRARANLERAQAELAAAEAQGEEALAEAGRQKAAAASLRAELGAATAERDRLQSLIREDSGLAGIAAANEARDQSEAEFREAQAQLGTLRERFDGIAAERDTLKRERTDLQLKLAALRDASDDSQLQQDNEVLRRMVERLNDQLKDLQPELERRNRRAGGVVAGITKAAISRCFLPDADVAGGR